MTTGKEIARRRLVAAALCVVMLAGCHHGKSKKDFAQAEEYVNGLHWESAIPLLKQHLLKHPRDVAAHFYLGRCYLNGPFCSGIAEGEFELALGLFRDEGKHSPIAGYSNEYFELRCHLELAKVYLKTAETALSHGAKGPLIGRLLAKCQRVADAAKHLSPNSPDVKQLQRLLDEFPRALPNPYKQAPPEGVPPNFAI